jgi:hypothetical protein
MGNDFEKTSKRLAKEQRDLERGLDQRAEDLERARKQGERGVRRGNRQNIRRITEIGDEMTARTRRVSGELKQGERKLNKDTKQKQGGVDQGMREVEQQERSIQRQLDTGERNVRAETGQRESLIANRLRALQEGNTAAERLLSSNSANKLWLPSQPAQSSQQAEQQQPQKREELPSPETLFNYAATLIGELGFTEAQLPAPVCLTELDNLYSIWRSLAQSGLLPSDHDRLPNAALIQLPDRELSILIENLFAQQIGLDPSELTRRRKPATAYIQRFLYKLGRDPKYPRELLEGYVVGLARQAALADGTQQILAVEPYKFGILKYEAPGGILKITNSAGKVVPRGIRYFGIGLNSENHQDFAAATELLFEYSRP